MQKTREPQSHPLASSEFRLPDSTHVGGVHLQVWSYPGALFFSAGGYHHHLGTNTWAAGPASPPHHARLLEWELVVPSAEDVTAASERIRAAGYVSDRADDGLFVADPWGTRVRVRMET